MKVTFERQFQADFKRVIRDQPHLKKEVFELVHAITELGTIPSSYNPHRLVNPRGQYSGYWELHLSEGKHDMLILYFEDQDKMTVRFIRIGSHRELFQGKKL